MSTEPTFDPRRKAAIRDLVVANAAAHPGRAGGRKRTALVASLVVIALTISGGTVAYALGTGLLDPAPVAAPTPSPTPTPTATPTPTSTPTPTAELPVPAGSDQAINACTVLGRMFQVDGASEAETKANAQARGAVVVADATAARNADPQWNELADAVTAAQARLIEYLDENTPEGIHALETAAAQARDECAPLGVTVVLEQG
ncbi:hypothetical protein [Leifsonia shinshuensis]|uniref:hypothetical protein n=1 Tax=Leifsonia shinshuensis TaxID=150026 RepID=UPI00285F3EF4|nr:hypothetical protein [Leifsonia shinshuensis]MDR6971866.1 hypothetical protein [Leifsonia shinshuensis]